MKRVYKSQTNIVFSGVLGGLGEYYDVDPVLLRLAFVVLDVLTGFFPGIIAYVIASIIVPEKPRFRETGGVKENKTEEQK